MTMTTPTTTSMITPTSMTTNTRNHGHDRTELDMNPRPGTMMDGLLKRCMVPRIAALVGLGALIVLGASCLAGSADQEPAQTATAPAPEEAYAADENEAFGAEGGEADDAPEAKEEAPARSGARKKRGKLDDLRARDKSVSEDQDGILGGMVATEAEAPATRSWFPETFLFEPLVVTDDSGKAEVRATVPDRLTTWRVLGLAHSRSGTQAGATASFLGTLPTYVELIVPPFLRVGDRARIPVQLVNTTADPVTAEYAVEATGATLAGNARARVTIPAGGSVVRHVEVRADRPGTASVQAQLGSADAVVRTIEVEPTGEPVSETRSGTLAAAREFTITGPPGIADADPALNRARLEVFPGALALLRSELSASFARGGLAEDAFALLLAGQAPELLRALGDEPDQDALRGLRIIATQRAVRHARVFDINSATLLAQAALAHGDDPVLTRLGQRAIQHIKSQQSPDGTCGGETGWPLQRLLVATAECARAAADSRDVVVRASGAFERHAEQIRDGYSAAAMLASGAVSGELADALRQRVLDGIEERPGGARVLAVQKGVVRADGVAPGEVEATAMAVLALEGHGDAPLADLGSTLLASYSPAWGWGDGRANLVCMEAVLQLFKEPVPSDIAIELMLDGAMVSRGTLKRERIREVLILDTSGVDSETLKVSLAGDHQWRVSADPAVPGLGFSLALSTRVPWQKDTRQTGLELAISEPRGVSRDLRVGQPADLVIRAAAPAGQSLKIELELPAGVQVDTGSLDPLVASGALSRYETPDGGLILHINPLEPAQAFTAPVRVIPTLAGQLQSGPSFLSIVGDTTGQGQTHQVPARWVIR